MLETIYGAMFCPYIQLLMITGLFVAVLVLAACLINAVIRIKKIETCAGVRDHLKSAKRKK